MKPPTISKIHRSPERNRYMSVVLCGLAFAFSIVASGSLTLLPPETYPRGRVPITPGTCSFAAGARDLSDPFSGVRGSANMNSREVRLIERILQASSTLEEVGRS